jgi:hypothetical protein
MTNRSYMIQTLSHRGQLIRSEIWNSSHPLGLGHPFCWVLEKSKNGIRIRNLLKLSAQEIAESEVTGRLHPLDEKLRIRISTVRYADFNSSWKSFHANTESLVDPTEFKIFKKSLLSSLSGLSMLLIFAFITSTFFKPKEVPLVPAQYAKLILTPPPSSSKDTAQGGSKRDEASERKTANLVKAFQSTQVQKSVQKLTSGGVLSLLSKSDLLSDKKAKSAINTMFDAGKKSHSLNPLAGLSSAPAVAVSEIGGAGMGEGTGKSLGYGKGERAGLSDQGKSFVTLDISTSKVEEGLSKDEVGKVIHSHLAEVRYCYESAMIKNADAQGKLIVDFVIQGSGAVKSGKIHSSTVNDPYLDQCIINHLLKWKFPKPKGSVDVAVAYPFIFKALGK